MIVLIDDDLLIRKSWEMAAKKADLGLSTYASVALFMKNSHEKSDTIYIDHDLGDTKNGLEWAFELKAQGFNEIYLATGHNPENFSDTSAVKGIIGKRPPF